LCGVEKKSTLQLVMSALLEPTPRTPEPTSDTALEIEESWYQPIAEFAGHTVGGTAIFLIIAGAAWVLHKATQALGSESPYLTAGLTTAEIFTFTADTVLFTLFVTRTFWRAARRMVKGWNS
jgi:hypothetical protein